MAGEQLFSKFVIKGGGKTFTEQSTILIFRQKPIRLIVVNAAVIDIRGMAGSPEILGFNHFEQAIDNRTDTVIYAVNKFVSLLAQGNPNIIELLGNDQELYVNMTPEGQMLLDESAAASL